MRFAGSFPAACGERVWHVAFAEPGRLRGARRRRRCGSEMGGQLAGQVRERPWRRPGLKPVLEFASPPLAEVVRDINKFSNNVMAQQLFLTLSLQQRGSGTFEGSREVLRGWWRDRFGGEPPVTDNGSGLSRAESVTARQLGAAAAGRLGLAADAGPRGLAAGAGPGRHLAARSARTSGWRT